MKNNTRKNDVIVKRKKSIDDLLESERDEENEKYKKWDLTDDSEEEYLKKIGGGRDGGWDNDGTNY